MKNDSQFNQEDKKRLLRKTKEELLQIIQDQHDMKLSIIKTARKILILNRKILNLSTIKSILWLILLTITNIFWLLLLNGIVS